MGKSPRMENKELQSGGVGLLNRKGILEKRSSFQGMGKKKRGTKAGERGKFKGIILKGGKKHRITKRWQEEKYRVVKRGGTADPGL